MAAAAWNLNKWLMAIFWFFFPEKKIQVFEKNNGCSEHLKIQSA
jgi:hypothetical protein